MSESEGIIGSILRRMPGSTNIEQEGEDFRVESSLQADDDLPSPISNTVKGTREEIQESKHDTVFDLYDALVDLDGELSGAVNAIAQSATYNHVVLPEDEPSSTEEDILEDCQTLAERIRGRELAIDVLRNLIKYGNDFNKKVYNSDEGIIAVQSLPANSVTMVDDRNNVNPGEEDLNDLNELIYQAHPGLEEDEEPLDSEAMREAFERDAYVLNELDEARRQIIEPSNVLHFAIDSRSNWHEDQVGRETYGIWGQSRLEALKFTIQTKYNTLTNKVAMDDKLLAREVYYVDTSELFGDIQDREDRIEAAEQYADKLATNIEELGPDERPMLPEHVSVEVIGPEGKAIDQRPFVEQLNNGIAAALTFPMAGLGRGTTSVKAGEEISSLWAENNIKNLRQSVVRGFEELFRDHIKLLYPDLIENHDEASDLGEMELSEDITVPTLEYEPFRQEDRSEMADQIQILRNVGVMSDAEARDLWGLPTDEESMEAVRDSFDRLQGSSGSSSGGSPPGGDEEEPEEEESEDEESQDEEEETEEEDEETEDGEDEEESTDEENNEEEDEETEG